MINFFPQEEKQPIAENCRNNFPESHKSHESALPAVSPDLGSRSSLAGRGGEWEPAEGCGRPRDRAARKGCARSSYTTLLPSSISSSRLATPGPRALHRTAVGSSMFPRLDRGRGQRRSPTDGGGTGTECRLVRQVEPVPVPRGCAGGASRPGQRCHSARE